VPQNRWRSPNLIGASLPLIGVLVVRIELERALILLRGKLEFCELFIESSQPYVGGGMRRKIAPRRSGGQIALQVLVGFRETLACQNAGHATIIVQAAVTRIELGSRFDTPHSTRRPVILDRQILQVVAADLDAFERRPVAGVLLNEIVL